MSVASVSESAGESLEEAIAQLWQEVFQLQNIDHDANFFELGGNSLLGMDLAELLANRLHIEMPVLTVFENPSIRAMTEVLTAER